MKLRTILLIASVLLLFPGFCAKNSDIPNTDSESVNSGVRTVHEDRTVMDTGKITVQKNMKYNFLGTEKSLTYSCLEKSENGLYDRMTYFDENKNEYTFTPDTNSVFIYIEPENRTETLENRENVSRAVSDIYLNALCSETLVQPRQNKARLTENFELISEKYDEYTEITRYLYSRKIQGYRTTESITVSLDKNGKLSCCTMQNIGKFDNITMPEIDSADVLAWVERMANGNYGETLVDFSIQDNYIDLKDRKPILVSNVSIKFKSGDNILSSGETWTLNLNQ